MAISLWNWSIRAFHLFVAEISNECVCDTLEHEAYCRQLCQHSANHSRGWIGRTLAPFQGSVPQTKWPFHYCTYSLSYLSLYRLSVYRLVSFFSGEFFGEFTLLRKGKGLNACKIKRRGKKTTSGPMQTVIPPREKACTFEQDHVFSWYNCLAGNSNVTDIQAETKSTL